MFYDADKKNIITKKRSFENVFDNVLFVFDKSTRSRITARRCIVLWCAVYICNCFGESVCIGWVGLILLLVLVLMLLFALCIYSKYN